MSEAFHTLVLKGLRLLTATTITNMMMRWEQQGLSNATFVTKLRRIVTSRKKPYGHLKELKPPWRKRSVRDLRDLEVSSHPSCPAFQSFQVVWTETVRDDCCCGQVGLVQMMLTTACDPLNRSHDFQPVFGAS